MRQNACTAPALFCLALLLAAACSETKNPPIAGATDTSDDDGLSFGDGTLPDVSEQGDASIDASDPALVSNRVRSCKTTFRYKTTKAVKKVQVAGDWDWDKPEDLELKTGEFVLNKTLSAGLHCYKFIVDDKWILDPGHAYRAWCEGVENSGKRVPDCTRPVWRINGEVKRTTDGLSAEVLLWRGSGNAAPKEVAVSVRKDFKSTAVEKAWRPSNESVVLDLSGLSAGKHTVVLEATMADGSKAEPLLLPFWVEASPFLWKDGLIYLAMVDRFVDGDSKNNPTADPKVAAGATWQGGDLAGVIKQIEAGWFEKLGVSAIWLTPVATVANKTHEGSDAGKIVSGYHGYWPIKARAVDPRFGTAEELEKLVAAAHGRGIRVLMDLVLNHVHSDHELYKSNPKWFRDGCVCGTQGCDWTEKALSCVFAPYMPDIDWSKNDASEHLLTDALWWLERFDLDGARVDAVKHIETSASFNLVARVREKFEKAGTDYFLTGETAMGWSGDTLADNKEQYGTINKYMGPFGVDGQFDFVLYHAVVDRVFAHDEKGMIHLDVWTGHSQTQYAAGAVMTPYVGSHDTARFLSRADYRGQTGHDKAVAGNKWTDEALPVVPEEDEPYGRSRLAMCWLLTIPGAPLLYMGDEYGAFGGKDPDNRHMWRGDKSLSARESALLAAIRKLGKLRRTEPSLRRGTYKSMGSTENVMKFVRAADGAKPVVVVLNKGGTTAKVVVDTAGAGLDVGVIQEVLGLGAKIGTPVSGGIDVEIPAFSCGVFK